MGARGSHAGRGHPPLRRAGTWTLLGAVLVLCALLFEQAAAQEGQSPRIRSIDFEGNRQIPDTQLRRVMRLRQPAWWRFYHQPLYPGHDFLASDLRAILLRYQDEGFPLASVQEAVVTYNEDRDAVRIRIHLEEGPRIRLGSVILRGTDPDLERKIRSAMDLAPGQPMSWTRLAEGRDHLEKVYTDRGYALSRGELSVHYRGDSADAVVDFMAGPLVHVDSVRIEGLRASRPKMVRRELTMGPGKLLTSKEVLNSQQRLLETGVFQRARVRPELPDSTEPSADLVVQVEERKQGWVGAGAGYSSSDRIRLVADWGQRNLTGMGRRIGVTGNLYYSLDPGFRGGGVQFREGLLQLDYLEPWLFRSRTRGLASPYIRWVQEAAFHQRTLGYNVSLRRDLSRATRATVGVQTKEVWTTEQNVVPRYTTRYLSLDYTRDARDNIFDPSQGHLLQGTFEYAGGRLGGKNRFDRGTITAQAYTSPQVGWVFTARVKVGNILPVGLGPVSSEADTIRLSHVPYEERFRLGGGNTVRGYTEGSLGRRDANDQPLGGLFLLLAGVEARFPLFWRLQGGLFLDAGNVWTEPDDVTLARFSNGFRERTYDPMNTAYGMGLGVRLRTPVGAFRVDYGFKVGSGRAPGEGPGNLHVALGQAY